MRQIKFRAWDGRSLYYGGFSIHATGKVELLPVLGPQDNDSLVIEQFTGLLDVNGAEIYEGDVISAAEFYLGDSFHKAGHGHVVWYDGSFEVFEIGKDEYRNELDSCAVHNYSIKVIGNIHSPEGGAE
jgi:uncharacterized phage protein (TIGR01671 family)